MKVAREADSDKGTQLLGTDYRKRLASLWPAMLFKCDIPGVVTRRLSSSCTVAIVRNRKSGTCHIM
jgi:hypothetical protein